MGWEVLGGLDAEQERAVLQTSVRRRYRKGEIVFHEGDAGDSYHLIEKGRAAVRVCTPLGDVATLMVLGPGDSFGELALVSPESRRTATVEALEPLETRMLRRNDLEDLRARHAAVEEMLVRILARTVERLSRMVLEALYVPADRRVLRRLHELADLWPGEAEVEIEITQEMLATMAGTTRPTANKVLREAESRGAVALRRGRIVITDAGALERMAR